MALFSNIGKAAGKIGSRFKPRGGTMGMVGAGALGSAWAVNRSDPMEWAMNTAMLASTGSEDTDNIIYGDDIKFGNLLGLPSFRNASPEGAFAGGATVGGFIGGGVGFGMGASFGLKAASKGFGRAGALTSAFGLYGGLMGGGIGATVGGGLVGGARTIGAARIAENPVLRETAFLDYDDTYDIAEREARSNVDRGYTTQPVLGSSLPYRQSGQRRGVAASGDMVFGMYNTRM